MKYILVYSFFLFILVSCDNWLEYRESECPVGYHCFPYDVKKGEKIDFVHVRWGIAQYDNLFKFFDSPEYCYEKKIKGLDNAFKGSLEYGLNNNPNYLLKFYGRDGSIIFEERLFIVSYSSRTFPFKKKISLIKAISLKTNEVEAELKLFDNERDVKRKFKRYGYGQCYYDPEGVPQRPVGVQVD